VSRDTYFGYCFVVGFEYIWWSYNSDRMHIEYINGDCTNGFYVSRCYDVMRISFCHLWPWYTSNSGGTADYPVTLAADNGSGLIRLTVGYTVTATLSNTNPAKLTVSPADIGKFAYGLNVKITGVDDPAMAAAIGPGYYFIYDVNTVTPNTFTINVDCSAAPAPETVTVTTNVLTTGDIVTVHAVGGVPASEGRWTATVVDPTHIDLQGSVFTGAYTSGGHVYLSAWRNRGTAFMFDYRVDGCDASNCFNYGWDVGFEVKDCIHSLLFNCASDNGSYTDFDTTTIGFRVTNDLGSTIVGSRMSGMGIGYYIDALPGYETMLTACESHGTLVECVHVKSGRAVITGGCSFYATPVAIYVDPASDGIYCVGNRCGGGTTTAINAPAGVGQRRSFVYANDWADATSMGNQLTYGETNLQIKWDNYQAHSACATLVGRKARGTSVTPTQAQASDSAIALRADLLDDTGVFRPIGAYRIQGAALPTSTSSPGKHVWSLTPPGGVALVDRLIMEETALYALPTQSMALGGPGARWTDVVTNKLTLPNNVSNPTAIVNHGQFFLNGTLLQFKFPSGTIKTIATDP
jgi:hypothetical protein